MLVFLMLENRTGCGLPLKIKVGNHTDFSTSIRMKKQAWRGGGVAGFRSPLEES